VLVFRLKVGEEIVALWKLRQVAFDLRSCIAGRYERICSRSSAVLKVAVMARRAGGRARVLALSSLVLVLGEVSIRFMFDLVILDGGLEFWDPQYFASPVMVIHYGKTATHVVIVFDISTFD
jgi:hypothetical protein